MVLSHTAILIERPLELPLPAAATPRIAAVPAPALSPVAAVAPEPIPTPAPIVPPSSRLVVPVEARNAAAEKGLRVFQLDRDLVVDHCAISAVALTISDEGEWTLSLRADQNPPAKEPVTLGGQPPQLYTAHLLRNQFHVEIRCCGVAKVVSGLSADDGPGKPVLCKLSVPDFWVQRGRPKHEDRRGQSDDLRACFRTIDRIEVDFYYYK
jgi:hypothetical protein